MPDDEAEDRPLFDASKDACDPSNYEDFEGEIEVTDIPR